MNKVLAIALVVLLGGGGLVFAENPAFATQFHNVAGAKVELPDLVKFSPDVSLGVELGKDIYGDVGYKSSNAWVQDDYGYYGNVVLTAKWTLVDLSKK